MIPPLKAIRKILWGNLKLNNRTVPVIQRSYPMDMTPCITIDGTGGSTFLQRYIINEDYPLSPSHPQYDNTKPFEKYPQQVIREKYQTSIKINTWSDNGDEREELNNQIQRLFYEAQSDHYRFCNNYEDGDCASLGCRCYGEYFDTDKRGVKHQCTNPSLYNYSNIFTTYNLERDTFHLDQPYTLEDRIKDDNVYRSVLTLHTAYYTDYVIGGLISQRLTVADESFPSYFIRG